MTATTTPSRREGHTTTQVPAEKLDGRLRARSQAGRRGMTGAVRSGRGIKLTSPADR